jgi:diaminohydroxyphosphoribosylaminopyrimidine deaminase/5-amino-6-(5-phosphoribosylamino)uracil reductase
MKQLQKQGIEIWVCPSENIDLRRVMKELSRRNITSLFVEGGSSVLGSFVDNQLVDKAYAFYGPVVIGGTSALSAIGGIGANTVDSSLHLVNVRQKVFENSYMLYGYVRQPTDQGH